MNRFTAYRTDLSDTKHTDLQKNNEDEPQFEGIIFTDGSCALRWLTPLKSTSIWPDFETAMGVHGHPEYGTKIIFHDKVIKLPWD
jgi:hypothetical protein